MSPRRAKVLGGETSPGALRRHLIAVTQHLVAAHGVVGLTTRKIAREAQVADGVLYNHFADKDELVLTALGERAAELVESFLADHPVAGSRTLEENLAALTRSALRLHVGTVPLITGLFGREELLKGFLAGIHGDQAGPLTAFVATVEYLRAEQRLGRVAAEVDPGAATELLFGACQHRALTTMIPAEGHPTTAADDVDSLVDTLTRALRPARRQPRSAN